VSPFLFLLFHAVVNGRKALQEGRVAVVVQGVQWVGVEVGAVLNAHLGEPHFQQRPFWNEEKKRKKKRKKGRKRERLYKHGVIPFSFSHFSLYTNNTHVTNTRTPHTMRASKKCLLLNRAAGCPFSLCQWEVLRGCGTVVEVNAVLVCLELVFARVQGDEEPEQLVHGGPHGREEDQQPNDGGLHPGIIRDTQGHTDKRNEGGGAKEEVSCVRTLWCEETGGVSKHKSSSEEPKQKHRQKMKRKKRKKKETKARESEIVNHEVTK